MKTLKDCEITDIIDTKYDVVKTLSLFKDSDGVIPNSKLQHYLDAINRKFKYALTDKVVNNVEKGIVRAVYSPELNLPKFLPVWSKKKGSDIITYVNLTPYRGIRFDTKGFLDGDIRTIYSMLQAGTIVNSYYNNYKRLIGNIGFLRYCMTAYTKLFIKVLDRLYGIKLNNLKANTLAFLVAKFFLINICGKEDNEATGNIAFNVCEKATNVKLIKGFDKPYKSEVIYKSLGNFIDFLSTHEDMVRKLSMREFYQSWIVMYDFSTLLSIELLEHLIILVGHVNVGSNINKVTVLDNLLKTESLKIYNEFSSLV